MGKMYNFGFNAVIDMKYLVFGELKTINRLHLYKRIDYHKIDWQCTFLRFRLSINLMYISY